MPKRGPKPRGQKIAEAEAKLKEVMIELRQRRKANPASFLVPNGKQEEFLRLPEFVNVFSTGNGVGKTIIASNIVVNLLWGPQSEWFDLPVYRDFPRPNRGRIVSTHKNIKESIIPKLHQWFPAGRSWAHKEKQEYEAKWYTDLGCEFDIMTYDTEPEQFEGPTLQWVWFDEPPPQAIFGACVSRLRQGGLIFMTMTPLYGGGWVFDRINNPWSKQGRWYLLMADIEDNCIEHGTRGTLKHSNIERMIEEYPPEEREARIKGVPIYLTGRVYNTFEPEVHVIPRSAVPEKGTLWHVNDPHDRKPFALGWYIVDESGDIYVVDEWPNTPYHELKTCSMDIKDYARIIGDKEADIGMVCRDRIIDARYGNRKSVHTNTTIRDEFDDVKTDKFPDGITYINSYTDDDASILAGHSVVKDYLRFDKKKPLGLTNKPKLYICDTCTNHIYQMLHYGYLDQKDIDKGIKEKVDLRFKDFPDLVRYLCMEVHRIGDHSVRKEEDEDEGHVPESWLKFRDGEVANV